MMLLEPATQDISDIVATCTDYAASWLEGDRDRMAACLHEGLAKRALVDSQTGSLELDESPYADMVASAARGPRPFGRDLQIEVHPVGGGIASASVLSEPWLDLLHLARFSDRWRIVNALYEPRPAFLDAAADRAAVAVLLDAYGANKVDNDAEWVLASHHPALAERRVVVGYEGGLKLADIARDEVAEDVGAGLMSDGFERRWDAQVLEVGGGVAAGKVVIGWLDVALHLARFGDRWMIVNILSQVLPVDQ